MTNTPIDDNILKNLSDEERKIALKVLQELYEGNTSSYDNLRYSDFAEIPVDIDTFLHEKQYLGNALYDADGRFTLFPYWEKKLKDIFPTNTETAYNTIVLTGAIGLGKSTIAVICLLYLLYRLLCLKDPYLYYGLQPTDKITISLMNITIENAKGVALDKMNQMILSSTWFMAHGKMSGITNLSYEPEKHIGLITASSNNQVIGRAIFANFSDEVNWGITSDTEKLKRKYKQLISQIDARMKSRFLRGTYLPTLNIIASSKNNEQSFLEDFISTKRKNESTNTLIVDEPQWVVDSRKDSPIKFPVAIGNKHLSNELLPLESSPVLLDEYRSKGYSIIMVPIGYLENFQENIDGALMDIAGIATSSATKYISGKRWSEVKVDSYSNPFTKEIIETGTAKEDTSQYSDFFDIDKIPPEIRKKPLYIHLDMSVKGDKTGIAGVTCMGKRPTIEGNNASKDMFYRLLFHVSIKAPKGYEISFEKNRTFIRWLKSEGFNIKGVSSDSFQSAALQQQLISDGFNFKIISVDRLDPETKQCLPYAYFKSTIYDRRIEIYKQSSFLTEEVLGLEREGDGHINHPEGGTQGCFTGDTKIRLVDGRSLTFLEIIKEFNENKINYVYSFNESTQKIEPKPIINAWCTQKNAPIMKVVLDNGEEIRCTLNHKFMNRDGSYTEAKDLKPLDSMMPLYTKISQKGLNGYRLYYEPMENKWHYEHRQFAIEVDDVKYLVHHKDCNKLNNSPNNLIWCSKENHYNLHLKLSKGCNSEEARVKKSEKMISYHQNKDEAYFERNNKIKTKQLENGKDTIAAKHREDIPKINDLFNINFNCLSRGDKLRYRKSYNISLKKGKIVNIKVDTEQRKKQLKIKKNQIALKNNQLELRNKWAKLHYGLNWEELTWGEKISYGREYKLGSKRAYINFESIKAKISYESLYKYYIIENHNGKETCKYFNISHNILTQLFKYYNIKKDRATLTENISSKVRYNIGYEELYNYYIIDNHSWEETYKHFGICGTTLTKLFKSYNIKKCKSIINSNISNKCTNPKNHKIAYIEFLNEFEDVYDITVQDNHNFALDAGVFVHNSKDAADAFCGALYHASQHAEEFAFEYGEDLNATLNINSSDNAFQQQVVIDLEKELNNMFGGNIKNNSKDFGMGKAQEVPLKNIMDGIIVF